MQMPSWKGVLAMQHRRSLAAAGAIAALGMVGSVSAAPALAAVPSVTVRVEGAKRALLPATTVQAPAHGSITKGHTPAGTCPANSAAGALDLATRHHWNGSYSSGLGIEVNTILGTTLSYAKGSYWGFYVNNRYAAAGICDTKLHRGEQLLFAAVPAHGAVPKPLVVTAPAKAVAGRAFTVHAFAYKGAGKATMPVSGVGFKGVKAKTNAKGVARITVGKRETLTLVGAHKGYIRSAAQTVTITKR